MTDSDEMYNRACAIFQEWGPRRRIPLRVRWQEAFPEVASSAMDDWETEFRLVERVAYELAERVRDDALSRDAAISELCARYPRLGREQAASACNHAYYHAIA